MAVGTTDPPAEVPVAKPYATVPDVAKAVEATARAPVECLGVAGLEWDIGL